MCLKHDESSLPEKYYYDSNTKNLKSVKNNSLNVKNKLMQMKMILNVYHAIHR